MQLVVVYMTPKKAKDFATLFSIVFSSPSNILFTLTVNHAPGLNEIVFKLFECKMVGCKRKSQQPRLDYWLTSLRLTTDLYSFKIIVIEFNCL